MHRGVAIAVLIVSVSASSARAADDGRVRFNRDIRPILSDNCFHCHGPDSAARQADLRLDSHEEVVAERDGYYVVVPGEPGRSELLARIESSDPNVRMPPPESGRSLTVEQRELLRRWIQQGAEWEAHWSLLPPRRAALPEVGDNSWCRNTVDRFTLARMNQAGLAPSPEASREDLIRRVSLDLTGLPPTPEQVEAFLHDSSPAAYERLVDRLLASPRYGEHMAWAWLEAARYADTDGYQNDGPRTMWRWRDWVIEAYNQNMPFDRFTIEQLAGDLLPNATLDQLIATGFNRNNRYNSEEGLVVDEFLLENAVDRVDTTATVWMGMTVACARCHDHKFDPISQKEYYQLSAYFDNVSETGRAVKFGNSEPYITAPTRLQQIELEKYDQGLQAARDDLTAAEAEIDAAQRQWEESLIAADEMKFAATPGHGLTHHFRLDAPTEKVQVELSGSKAFEPQWQEGVFDTAVEFGGGSSLNFGNDIGDFRNIAKYTLSLWIKPTDVSGGAILSRMDNSTQRKGVLLELRDGHLQYLSITRWISGVAGVETRRTLQPGRWHHVLVSNDGQMRAGGLKIYVDGVEQQLDLTFNTDSNKVERPLKVPLRLGARPDGDYYEGLIDELRIYDRLLTPTEIRVLAQRHSMQQLIGTPADDRTASQQEKLRQYFLEHAAPQQLRDLALNVRKAREARETFYDSLPTTMIMQDLDPPRPTRVRLRGSYSQLGDEVQPDVPEALPSLPADAPPNRLALARWLVDGRHPLTARVAVNRYWQMLFGTGLVKTAEDFGAQGASPSHEELLDWLAVEFVESGWDVKAMLRLIVTSATYRQSSSAESEVKQRDPENRLLARGPRMRLPAHVLRDQALFASGLLDARLGGPSVKPYQPPGLWQEMSNFRYEPSRGADLYRRSLYTYWKRTLGPPVMVTFDAADRETCVVQIRRTNTPLQALALLNETAFFEAARNFAARIVDLGGGSLEQRVGYGFQAVTGRLPDEQERQLLVDAWHEYREEYRESPERARQLLSNGGEPPADEHAAAELAAYTVMANVLLNLDEALTKE